jgi:hypothetical protein
MFQVVGKIEGRPPKAFGFRENIEQNLSDHKDHEFSFQLQYGLKLALSKGAEDVCEQGFKRAADTLRTDLHEFLPSDEMFVKLRDCFGRAAPDLCRLTIASRCCMNGQKAIFFYRQPTISSSLLTCILIHSYVNKTYTPARE